MGNSCTCVANDSKPRLAMHVTAPASASSATSPAPTPTALAQGTKKGKAYKRQASVASSGDESVGISDLSSLADEWVQPVKADGDGKNMMHVYLRCANNVACIEVDHEDTVGDLKLKVSGETGIDANALLLQLEDGSMDMADDTALSDTGITADSWLGVKLTDVEEAKARLLLKDISIDYEDLTAETVCAMKERDYAALLDLITVHSHEHMTSHMILTRDITPLMAAACSGDARLISLFIEAGMDVNHQCPDRGLSPLCYAARMGNYEAAEVLLQNGATQRTGNESSSPLMYAATYNKPRVVDLLLRYGGEAVVNEVSPYGDTALVFAAQHGHHVIAQALLSHGANPDPSNRHDATPLMYAAQSGHTRVVSLLLDHGASTNRSKSGGWTPLMLSARRGHTDIATLLCRYGASPLQPNHAGHSSIDIAQRADMPEMASLLRTLC